MTCPHAARPWELPGGQPVAYAVLGQRHRSRRPSARRLHRLPLQRRGHRGRQPVVEGARLGASTAREPLAGRSEPCSTSPAPKSFVPLDGADHLLTDSRPAAYGALPYDPPPGGVGRLQLPNRDRVPGPRRPTTSAEPSDASLEAIWRRSPRPPCNGGRRVRSRLLRLVAPGCDSVPARAREPAPPSPRPCKSLGLREPRAVPRSVGRDDSLDSRGLRTRGWSPARSREGARRR